MGYYVKKCPHCEAIIEQGASLPNTRFGNPQKRCRFCGSAYIDSRVIDWPSASVWQRILFCLANGRIFLCLVVLAIAGGTISTLAGILFFLLSLALCVAFVLIKVKRYYGYVPIIKRERRH